ncbi:MAG TPA: VCBS repeat-containing protein [Verrucomicrobiae bacterium]|nr:VCBS repeat-containing protein [Verrucomicrobiae bacterium]
MSRVFLFAGLIAVVAARAGPLQWEQYNGYRAARLNVPQNGRTGFTLLTPDQTGIHFTNQLGYARSEENQNLLNGAGVAAGDVDGDGLCDLYFCNLEGPNGLYRNKGDWKFEDIAAASSAQCTNQTPRGVTMADVNGDGYLDILITSLSGPNALLLNDGKGRFTDVTERSGMVQNKAGGHTIAVADVDGDGDLDVYVANYGENSILRSGGDISIRYVGGKPVVSGRHAARLKIINGRYVELGQADVLFLNDGKGSFTPVAWNSGTFLREDGTPFKSAPMDMGLSAMFRDVNGDGAPDLYVCNDFQSPDRFWLNDGKGVFRLTDPLTIRTTCHFSMGVDFADIDRDGRDDFIVCDMLSRIHELRMRQMGATNPSPDEVGEVSERQQVRRNTLFWNRSDGTYAEIANFAELDATEWTWSVVFLDVDLDGYEDLLVSNGHAYDTQDLDMQEKAPAPAPQQGRGMRAAKRLKDFPKLETPNLAFRNRHNLTFEEIGKTWGFSSSNVSHGISLADLDNDGDLDVVVSCLWKAPLIYRNESAAPRLAVRLKGKAPNTRGIGAKITVRDGAVPLQTQQMICGGRYLSGDDAIRVFAAGDKPMRIEVTWRSGKRSLIEGALANHIYEIDETGATEALPQTHPEPTKLLFKNVSAILNHKDDRKFTNDLERQPLLARQVSDVAPLLALDERPAVRVLKPAFIGGRPMPGRYAEAEPLQFAGRTFNAGIVNNPLLADLDGDGMPELILACEWGPIRVYRDRTEITAKLGLDKFNGWWQGVTVGDLNGDGALDIVASNWGLNSSYGKDPIALYYGDFDGNGTMDIFETCWDAQLGRMVQRRDLQYLSAGLPLLRLKFPTHLAYSQTPAESILKEWPNAKKLEANTLASMLFLNRGGKFEAVPLPDQAQWAPAFGVCVADFDGDGNEDVFLSQNFFGTRPEEPRLDAGRGLLLQGNGDGTLRPISGDESGIKIYGEQRACAFADYDGDGRTDLLVGQNHGATQLFHNEAAKPGLRVRLAGVAEGAVIRLKAGQQFGPARAIHNGSNPVQVMTMRETPTHVWVRWPGGKTSLSEIPAAAKEVEIKP